MAPARPVSSLLELEERLGIKVPAEYCEYLSTRPTPASTEELRGGHGRQFYLYRERTLRGYGGLFTTSSVDGHTVATWRELSAYVEGMREDEMDDIHIVGTRRRAAGKSLDWLASRIAIGDGNGDVVFFDQDDWSVWVFYHDGCEVERLAESFSELEVIEE